MALDNFKSNLSKQDLERQLNEKWGSEVIRIRTEILDDFCSFLKTEGFTIREIIIQQKHNMKQQLSQLR